MNLTHTQALVWGPFFKDAQHRLLIFFPPSPVKEKCVTPVTNYKGVTETVQSPIHAAAFITVSQGTIYYQIHKSLICCLTLRLSVVQVNEDGNHCHNRPFYGNRGGLLLIHFSCYRRGVKPQCSVTNLTVRWLEEFIVNCVPWSPASQRLTVFPAFHLHSLFHSLWCACVCLYRPGYCCLAKALHSPTLAYSLLSNGSQIPWSVFKLFLRLSYMGSYGLCHEWSW